jgi:hypothetical protein
MGVPARSPESFRHAIRIVNMSDTVTLTRRELAEKVNAVFSGTATRVVATQSGYARISVGRRQTLKWEALTGLDATEAREQLRRDAAQLAQWLERDQTRSAGAAYVAGYLAVLPSGDLSAEPRSLAKQPRVVFVPPEGFEDVGGEEGTRFRRGKVEIMLSPVDRLSFVRMSGPLPVGLGALRAAFPDLPELADTEVSFGAVKGRKRRATKRGRLPCIDYLLVLQRPG